MGKMTDVQRQFVMDNYKLPYFVIGNYFPNYIPGTLEYEELTQEGFVALCMAAVRYNNTVGMFSTYATRCIWGYMVRHIHEKNSWTVHSKQWRDLPSFPIVSINTAVFEDETGELQNIIPDPDNRYGAVEAYIDAVPIFRKASPKYGEQVLHLLLQGYNQVEIGKRLGISYEWVRKIMYKAKKLKGEKL